MHSMLRLIGLAALLASACSSSEARHDQPSAAPGAVMRHLIEPARPCIERFRGRIEDPYFTQVRLTPTAGLIGLAFESGPHHDFNSCVVDAVAKARIPADTLAQSVVVPFAFSFAPATN